MGIFKAPAFQGWVTQILLVLVLTENTPADDSQSICFFCCTLAKQTFPHAVPVLSTEMHVYFHTHLFHSRPIYKDHFEFQSCPCTA